MIACRNPPGVRSTRTGSTAPASGAGFVWPDGCALSVSGNGAAVVSRTSNVGTSALLRGLTGSARGGKGGGLRDSAGSTRRALVGCGAGVFGTGINVRGGWTGATGRGETSVRGVTGGGTFAVRGCPSASKNFRICSSSDWGRVRVCCSGESGSGNVDSSSLVDSRFDPAAFASNRKSAAIAMSNRNSKLSIAAIVERISLKR